MANPRNMIIPRKKYIRDTAIIIGEINRRDKNS